MSAVMISDHFQHERTKAARGTMKSQRMRLAMRGTVIFGHIEKLAFAFSYLRRRRKCMTVVGDTLSAA